MAEAKMKLMAGALPYSDGSGDQVTATVEKTEEGLMLRFEVVHHIRIDDWADVRRTIDELVQSAYKISRSTL